MNSKIIKKFKIGKKRIIFRYPALKDVDDYLELINYLVKEKAMINVQEKCTRKQEMNFLKFIIGQIKKGNLVHLVVEVDGKVMGNAGIPKGRFTAIRHIGELGIILRKEIRGIGIGRKLLNCILKEAKNKLGMKIAELGVFENNEIAKKLYKSCGFKKIGTIKGGYNYYGRYTDSIIMVKYLK